MWCNHPAPSMNSANDTQNALFRALTGASRLSTLTCATSSGSQVQHEFAGHDQISVRISWTIARPALRRQPIGSREMFLAIGLDLVNRYV